MSKASKAIAEAECFDAIRRGVRYGYDLTKATGLRSGRVYPALGRLEDQGLIVGEFEDGPEPRRRAYRLNTSTPSGD